MKQQAPFPSTYRKLYLLAYSYILHFKLNFHPYLISFCFCHALHFIDSQALQLETVFSCVKCFWRAAAIAPSNHAHLHNFFNPNWLIWNFVYANYYQHPSMLTFSGCQKKFLDQWHNSTLETIQDCLGPSSIDVIHQSWHFTYSLVITFYFIQYFKIMPPTANFSYCDRYLHWVTISAMLQAFASNGLNFLNLWILISITIKL